MPIRTASLTKRISENGQALHRAMMSRGDGQEPSADEKALAEERQHLKEEREKRKAQALEPKKSAVDKLVRTHHAQAKEKPKATKDAHDAIKKPKARRSRAEKHAEQAAAVEAARNSRKKAPTK
ncbi:hypothetical protein HHL11_25370 [Ramlibacter sp. G-1-2-2]|uniref:Uncharacterized protein n=1 Tax=Ramlibacter agri TaxID=2728837 RepID=A0A848HCI8_9BURK|nr:hypothetical protein [Ramlibacter agri]NML47101.1 hypothetical protein [Ramlibacter agri]